MIKTSRRIVWRRHRARRAAAAGLAAGFAFSLVFPLAVVAAEPAHYRDEFRTEDSFWGSDGSHPWISPWNESGETDGPSSGAIQVPKDSHCHTASCLRIGQGGGETAQVTRAFYSAGASSIQLTFDYKRHPHGAGAGEVRLLSSPDGSSWKAAATFPLSVDDGSQITTSHDISSAAGPVSLVRFELIGGTDDSHINIDNVDIHVTFGRPPSFNQDVSDRTDPVGASVTIDAGATDPEGHPLRYWATGLPDGVGIDPGTGLIAGTIESDAADSSPHTVTVKVSDGSGIDTDTFTWTITDSNRPPAPATPPGPVEGREGEFISVAVEFTDPDEDDISFTAMGLPNGLAIDRSYGVISGVPATGTSLASPYTVRVTASDDDDAEGSVTFTMTIEPPFPPTSTTSTTKPTTTTSTTAPATTTTPPTTTSTTKPTTTTTAPATTTTTPPTTTSTTDPTTTTNTTAPASTTTAPPPAATPTTRAPQVSPPAPAVNSTSTTTQADRTVPASTAPRAVRESDPPTALRPGVSPGGDPESLVPFDPSLRPELAVEDVVDAKDTLVVPVDRAPVETPAPTPNRIRLVPQEGLAVTFVSSVETFRTNLLTSVGLGVAVAVLLLLGIDERRERTAPAAG